MLQSALGKYEEAIRVLKWLADIMAMIGYVCSIAEVCRMMCGELKCVYEKVLTCCVLDEVEHL